MNTSIEALLNASAKYIAHHWEKLGWVGPLSHFLALLQSWWLPLVVSDCTSAILVYMYYKFYICARQVGGERVELIFTTLGQNSGYIYVPVIVWKFMAIECGGTLGQTCLYADSAHMPQPLNPIVLRFIPFLFITTAAHFWGFNIHRKGYWSMIGYSIQ